MGRAKVCPLRRNVYQQDELSPPHKVELLRVNGATAANVVLAANVFQQDELHGVKEVISSFAGSAKSRFAGQAGSSCGARLCAP